MDTRGRSRSIEGDRRRHRERSPPKSHQERSPKDSRRSPSRSPKPKRRRSRSRSDSRSSSADSRKHRKRDKDRHHKKRKRSRSKDRDKSRSRSRSRERRKKKKDKKERKEKKSKSHGGPAAHWGKYGIISEADMFTKEQEFRLWLLEERQLNHITLPKPQLKKLFLTFIEDYNTATLPHEKYYALEAYESRMNMLRAGGTLPAGGDEYDWERDMREHKKGTTIKRKDDEESFLSKEQLMELRKVQSERVQIGKMKALGFEIKGSMGVRMDGNEFE